MNIETQTVDKYCRSCNLYLPLSCFHKAAVGGGCKYGKVSKCKSCRKIYNQARYLSVKEDMLKVKKQQREERPEIHKEALKRYRIKNPQRISEMSKNWKARNLDKVRHNIAGRRAGKLKASPAWLTTEHKALLRLYYKLALKLSKINSIKYHVDHIVPLQGDGVCGLHVPWNLQVIPASENLSKGNRF